MDLESDIKARAKALGFHDVGIARVEPLQRESRELSRWLRHGLHAGMRYLERWAEVRHDPAHPGMVAGARSVVAVVMAYPWQEASETGILASMARYARGNDYHDEVRSRLETLLAELGQRDPTIRGRALVDTAPLFERAWAARAGLGWIGRNTCLIHPELGSALVLGELVLTVELEPDRPIEERCGACRACVDACPTAALERPDGRRLDARRCLSYWTVEAREELPRDLSERSETLFGCDACQEACPWNGGRLALQSPLEPSRKWREVTLAGVAAMPLEELGDLLRGTALERAGAKRIRGRARALLDRSSTALPGRDPDRGR